MKSLVLIKYGEITLKGRNRGLFESILMDNLRAVSGVSPEQIICQQARIYLRFQNEAQAQACYCAVSRVFGVVGYAIAHELPFQNEINHLSELVIHLLKRRSLLSPKAFRVATRRATKLFSMESMAVDRAIGSAILEAFPEWTVNLSNPDLTVFIEIRQEGLFVYLSDQEEKGVGGLPVGVSGRGLLLLSGGIDSPVAGWSMMKRGMLVDAVHFHSFPYTGEKSKEKAVDLARELTRWKLRALTLYIPYFTNIQEIIKQQCPEAYWTVLHRRFMARIAEQIARGVGNETKKIRPYQALITGDNLGQVASQTIENMSIVDQSVQLPILRPLISFDKMDIIALAEAIGTFPISIRPHEDCCVLFASKNPKTKAIAHEVAAAEASLDVNGLIQEALSRMEWIKIPGRGVLN